MSYKKHRCSLFVTLSICLLETFARVISDSSNSTKQSKQSKQSNWPEGMIPIWR